MRILCGGDIQRTIYIPNGDIAVARKADSANTIVIVVGYRAVNVKVLDGSTFRKHAEETMPIPGCSIGQVADGMTLSIKMASVGTIDTINRPVADGNVPSRAFHIDVGC